MLLALLLALVLTYSIKFWRALAPTLRPSEHLRAFISILDRFSDLGHAREYGETRERYAERLTELSPSFALLTETHLRLSLGHGSDEDAVVVNKLCGLVRNELTASVPFWMRLIGWINPWDGGSHDEGTNWIEYGYGQFARGRYANGAKPWSTHSDAE